MTLEEWAAQTVEKLKAMNLDAKDLVDLGHGVRSRRRLQGVESLRLLCVALGIDPFAMPVQRIVITADVHDQPKAVVTLSPRVQALTRAASMLDRVECDIEIIHPEDGQ